MSLTCHHHDVPDQNRAVLWVVFLLNFCMFWVEVWQGMAGNSTALIADSMDFLSDSFSYLVTLYVLGKSLATRAKAALSKAFLMLLVAAGVLWEGAHNFLDGTIPQYTTMGTVGIIALVVNVVCALLLYGSRERDSNMQSVWLCSRNDAIGNLAIIVAAGLVYITHSLWPDLIVALIMVWLGGSSALKIISQAKQELKHDH